MWPCGCSRRAVLAGPEPDALGKPLHCPSPPPAACICSIVLLLLSLASLVNALPHASNTDSQEDLEHPLVVGMVGWLPVNVQHHQENPICLSASPDAELLTVSEQHVCDAVTAYLINVSNRALQVQASAVAVLQGLGGAQAGGRGTRLMMQPGT